MSWHCQQVFQYTNVLELLQTYHFKDVLPVLPVLPGANARWDHVLQAEYMLQSSQWVGAIATKQAQLNIKTWFDSGNIFFKVISLIAFNKEYRRRRIPTIVYSAIAWTFSPCPSVVRTTESPHFCITWPIAACKEIYRRTGPVEVRLVRANGKGLQVRPENNYLSKQTFIWINNNRTLRVESCSQLSLIQMCGTRRPRTFWSKITCQASKNIRKASNNVIESSIAKTSHYRIKAGGFNVEAGQEGLSSAPELMPKEKEWPPYLRFR